MTQVITTRNKPKPFAWSYSKLKNFEACPKKHFHVDIKKDAREEDSEALTWGNAVHKALALRVSKGVPLPAGMGHFDKWAKRITSGPGELFVEQQLAITDEFLPCEWFDSSAWYRGIGDVIKVIGPVALVADYKTGKILEDSVQLALMAACVFAHYPKVMRVRSEFIWLKEDANSRADFTRESVVEVWKATWPRIELLKNAHNTQDYPAKPGRLCRNWCPVKICKHHGERH